MSKVVTTVSGSVYEVDEADKNVRRLNGKSDPTPRIGKDGDWRGYDSILGPVVNESMIIVWGKNVSLLPGSDGGTPVTMTSPVASIEEVN